MANQEWCFYCKRSLRAETYGRYNDGMTLAHVSCRKASHKPPDTIGVPVERWTESENQR